MENNTEKALSYHSDIFHFKQGKSNKILPIIKNTFKIRNLISFLKSKKNIIDNKLEIISKLFFLFQSNISLIPFFLRECKKNNLNLLYESIFDIYLYEDIKRENEEFLEKLIKLIITNTTLPKAAPDYLYQKLSRFFKIENCFELNEKLFMKYLNLLHLCYKDNSIDNEENISNDIKPQPPAGFEEIGVVKKNKEIKNYMYFSGINSSLTLNINKNSSSAITDFPNLENGLSFVFWINLDKNVLTEYYNIYNNENNPFQIDLITLNISEHKIKFILKENKYFQLIVDKTESNLMDINSIFFFGEWVNVCFIINKKVLMNPATIKIYINGVSTRMEFAMPKDFPLRCKINKIILFQNLIGRVSSLLFFSFPLSQKLINYFAFHLINGIYNNKILFKFLISNDNNYFKNSINYKYYIKYKNENIKEKINILLKEQNFKNIISIFPPFSYNNRGHYIDDIFGNYIAIFSNNDGVNNFVNYIKNIQMIGGINNLLPIAELMLKYRNTRYNIISEKSILKYLNIFKDIIIEHNDNLYDANKNYFFSNLGLFLERFPSNIYTEKLLYLLLDIGKEVFLYSDNDNKNINQNYNYINTILLNEKIFSKFSYENQVKLWDEVHKFFISDYSKIKESLNIYKICILLRFYDENRYKEYCCQKHANIIQIKSKSIGKNNNKNIKNIMNPEMNVKTEKLFETIQLYMNKIGEDTVTLYKLLLLDLSPCLQIKIIKVYIDYFISKIEEEKKEKTFFNLLNNKFLDISEYVLSISLLDVRVQILKLIKILFQIYRKPLHKFFKENQKKLSIFLYIEANIFPEKLLIEIDNEKKYKDDKDYIPNKRNILSLSLRKRSLSPLGLNKKRNKFGGSFYEKNVVHKDRIPLIKYINKDIYEEEKEDLWRLLSSWITFEKVTQNKKNGKILKINNYAINFCMSFATKNNLKYVTNFLIILIAYLNDDGVFKTEDLYSNNKLLTWIIETIFYYNNKENVKNFHNENDQENIENIQKKSFEVFKIFINNNNNPKIKNEELVKFIINYSIYLKSEVEQEKIKDFEKNHKKNDISRVTSSLLLICLEMFPMNINFMTKICFYFMVYYKNYKIIINKNDEINNDINSSDDSKDDEDDDDSFEVVDKQAIKKNSIIIIDNNPIINENKILENNKFNNTDSFIPLYILEGINYDPSQFESDEEKKIDEEKEKMKLYQSVIILNLKKNKNKLKKNVLLKEIWKDFSLYDNIIDYYYSNLWGLENLCKKVQMEYDNKPAIIIKKLYQEYSNNKKYKSILLEPILECFNIKNNVDISENKNIKLTLTNISFNSESKMFNFKRQKTSVDSKGINILTINLILLSIAIEITNDKDQTEYLENQYEQFLIFCILASINIKSNEKHYNLIQNELFNILGYGCLFLKNKNESKYQQIINYLINPIFKDINEVSGLKKMFGTSKKKMYSNCAAYKVFSTKEVKTNDANDDDLFLKTKTLGSSLFKNKKLPALRSNSFDDITNLINNNKLNINSDSPTNSDDEFEDLNKKKLSGGGDDDFDEIDIKNFEVKPELQVDKDKRIDEIYNTILNKYKKFDNKIKESIKIIIKKITNKDLINKERKAVFNEIKKLIPQYIEKLKKYSNNSYFIEKLRRNAYKKSKIKLFSWRGAWSNKYLFFTHPEYLKLKIKNHYTKEMIKPVLTPVLDIVYYLPNFKSFKVYNLFNTNNYFYNINLDIDQMLKDENKPNSIINSNKESFISSKNVYGFNYLECLYKMQDKEIWELYKLFYEEQLNTNKIVLKRKEFLINLTNKNEQKKKKGKISTHSFDCCIVKIMNHIKGYINTKNEDYFEFIYDDEEEANINNNNNKGESPFEDLYNLDDDISYDKEMGCCYGSLFKRHKRDKEKIYFKLNYSEIKYLFIRNYYYRDTAVEIYTENNKSYFLNFKTKDDLSLFISDITDNNTSNTKFRQINASVHDDKDKNKLLGYEKIYPYMKNKSYFISNKIEKWQNYEISTLEFLMWVNIYAGRSFNDLNQYPVFPWTIKNYSSNKISDKDYRNLDTPMGMLELNEKCINRKSVFIAFYETLKNEFEGNYPDIDYVSFLNKGQEYLTNYKKKKLKNSKKNQNNDENFDIPYNQIPYNYGTHYSNPTYVSHYLSRIFPFSFVSIEIHGNKFDDPERMFFSLEKTFESVTTLKDDIRELIPEFYFFPEIFKNINNLNLAQNKCDSDGKEFIINDVDMPPWSNNNSINFVLEMRKYLESDEIPIIKWIDLIFGSYQRGENSENKNNIYMSYTYERMIKIMEISDYDQRSALLRLYETGVTPRLIFKNDLKPRIEKSVFLPKFSSSDLNFLEESPVLDRNNLKMAKFNLLNNVNKENEYANKVSTKIVKISIINNENVKIFSNTNQYFNLKTKKESKKDKKDEKKINDEKQNINNIINNSSKYAANYQISSIETPIIIYNNNKLMLKGGFWDGRIEINSLQTDIKEENYSSMIFPGFSQPIVIMQMSKNEKLLLCGTKDGAIISYDVDGKKLEFKDIIYSHNDEITSISINDNLNMFATTSLDGYIMIYILPSFQLVRSIHISSLEIKLNSTKQNNINKKEDKNKINDNVKENDKIEKNKNEKKENEIINENIDNEININKIIENKEDEEENKINNNNEIIENLFKEQLVAEYKEDKCLYAENVFLSSSPLACVAVFISNKNIFRSYTINGELINEIEEVEESTKIYSPIIYKNLNFHDFLIYGTNNGYIKIRAFPKMNLINSIKIYDDCEIKTLVLSNDNKYCYAWGKGDTLSIISDNIISDFQEL